MARKAALIGSALFLISVLNMGVARPVNPAAAERVQLLQALSSQLESQDEIDRNQQLQNEVLEEEGRVDSLEIWTSPEPSIVNCVQY